MEFSQPKPLEQNCLVEWTFASEREYDDPFNKVMVSAIFTDPDGERRNVPAFWAGGNTWRLRYSSHKIGEHHLRTVCSDESNPSLHGRKGSVEIDSYTGKNHLLKHGPLRISRDKRHLEHVDGRPFFWLGDTWWMGLTKRLRWPEDFKSLTEDRARKGFSVVQIVAGLYPDMPPFDPRGANEAGFPWKENYVRIDPAYFDMADRRIDWLVRSSLVPCIVGSWGYFIEFAGEETMKKHWRNLVARYGAYPVVWCVAGEAVMPYYLSPCWDDKKKREEYAAKARSGWTRVARYLRSQDPYHHPITIHPTDCARNMVDDPSVIDIDMLQTGHSDFHSFPNTVNNVVDSSGRLPKMPVLVGEVCYEGIMGASWENVQRLMFWASILSGATGYTYGANGIWQVNTRTRPFGPSPHGQSWGDTPWSEAYQLPGSIQVSLGKDLLKRYPWWRFKPCPELVEPHWSKGDFFKPYASGIPKQVRIIYIPLPVHFLRVKGIEQGVAYRASYLDPRRGREYDVGIVTPNEEGEWQPPKPKIIQDWVLVMEAKSQQPR